MVAKTLQHPFAFGVGHGQGQPAVAHDLEPW
jgi:hypothetical protein